MPSGKISWFDDPQTASGILGKPGIALYNQDTLRGYYRVKFPNGRTVVYQQVDIGPAPWTKRAVDVNKEGLAAAGYHSGNFPTDSTVQYDYLGKKLPAGIREGVQGGAAVAPGRSARPAGPQLTGLNPTPAMDLTPGGTGLTSLIAGQQAGATAQPRVPAVSPIANPSFSSAKDIPGFNGLAQVPQVGAPIPPADTLGSQLAGLAGLRGPDIARQQQPTATPQLAPSGGGKAPAASGGPMYRHPAPGNQISSHDNGADFETRPGTALLAVGAGTVVNTQGQFPGGSIVIKLDHSYRGQQYVYYGHLGDSNKSVRVGQRVTPGQVVARTAQSPPGAGDMPGHTEIGFATGPNGAIQTGGAFQGNRSVGSPLGALFGRFLGYLH